ncbi:hypothetical protein Pcac1_g8264 [Phytophthora cactorum]|nr:hypothetical protein Pcac1_g8264 [Phytophthora cactorum]
MRSSTIAGRQTPSSQDAAGQTREASMTELMTTPPFDAREHAVLLEFLDNFHPSEIDHDEPLPYTQDSDFLLDVDDVEV